MTAVEAVLELATVFPMETVDMDRVGQPPRDCWRRFADRRAFLGSPKLQGSRRDGLIEFSVPRVPQSGGVQAGWLIGLEGLI